jgi:hypothetical protein
MNYILYDYYEISQIDRLPSILQDKKLCEEKLEYLLFIKKNKLNINTGTNIHEGFFKFIRGKNISDTDIDIYIKKLENTLEQLCLEIQKHYIYIEENNE